MFITKVCLYILVKGCILFLHPVHVSITNVDYNPNDLKMKISFKVFKQDMQLLFVHLDQVNIDFENLGEVKKNQERINNYFQNHFNIESKSGFEPVFKEAELDNEWIWFYYEVENIDLKKEFKITNTIFLDLYYDQKNMMIFSIEGTEKGYMFNLNKTKQLINLNDL